MKKLKYLNLALISTAIIGFNGCNLKSMPPNPNIDSLPVCVQGEPIKNSNTPCVVKIPAGSPIYFKTTLQGELFKDSKIQNFSMTLKRDIFIYFEPKQKDNKMIWVSYDKKSWKPMYKAFHGKVNLDANADQTRTQITFFADISPAF